MEYSKSLGRRLLSSLALGIVVALIVAAVIVFVLARPPHQFRIAAGASGGAYVAFAEALREDLAARGFRVEIVETAGSVDNVALLQSGGADVGIVQSGTDTFVDMRGLSAISELFYEPIWVFRSVARVPVMASLADIIGKQVGIGPEGSGTNLLARESLGVSGIDASNTTLVAATTAEMLEMLRDGTLDVAVVVASPDAPIVTDYAMTPGLAIFDGFVTEAIERHYPFVTSLVLPRGVLDMRTQLPAADVPLVGVRATLMGRSDLQADLVRLLAGSVGDALPFPWIGDPTDFPGLATTRFPVNEEAARYFKEGPTALEQFLPFDIASPLSRWWVLLLPLLVLLFPLAALAKAGWTWYNTSRIVGWYPRLHWIEQNLDRFSIEQLDTQAAFLNDLDVSLPTRTHVSAGYLAAYYDMRRTVLFVSSQVAARREELSTMEAAGAARVPDFTEAPPETPEFERTTDGR